MFMQINISSNKTNENLKLNTVNDKKNLKNSGYWNPPFIHIDNNWSDSAAALPWVQGGDGSSGNPYIIENVTIDAGGNNISAIFIENSIDYFIIRNCTISNTGPEGPIFPFYCTGGILLYNVTNGKLIKNDCSDNTHSGIHLQDCDNNIITENIVTKNRLGISLDLCDYNNITGNYANNNYDDPLDGLVGGLGMFIQWSNYNNISDNTANNNQIGIELQQSNYNTVSGNTFIGNGYKCISEINCIVNYIYNNICKGKEGRPVILSYDIYILIGAICVISGILIKKIKRSQKLN